jgi:hypothetical protein
MRVFQQPAKTDATGKPKGSRNGTRLALLDEPLRFYPILVLFHGDEVVFLLMRRSLDGLVVENNMPQQARRASGKC